MFRLCRRRRFPKFTHSAARPIIPCYTVAKDLIAMHLSVPEFSGTLTYTKVSALPYAAVDYICKYHASIPERHSLIVSSDEDDLVAFQSVLPPQYCCVYFITLLAFSHFTSVVRCPCQFLAGSSRPLARLAFLPPLFPLFFACPHEKVTVPPSPAPTAAPVAT